MPIDAFRGCSQATVSALPNLNEDQDLPVQHDEIQFAGPTMVIALQFHQALAAQEVPGAALASSP